MKITGGIQYFLRMAKDIPNSKQRSPLKISNNYVITFVLADIRVSLSLYDNNKVDC